MCGEGASVWGGGGEDVCEREIVCVCERERESERVCVCADLFECKYMHG